MLRAIPGDEIVKGESLEDVSSPAEPSSWTCEVFSLTATRCRRRSNLTSDSSTACVESVGESKTKGTVGLSGLSF